MAFKNLAESSQSLSELLAEGSKGQGRTYERAPMTNLEVFRLLSRGMSVSGDLLDGISKDHGRANAMMRAISRGGKILFTLAKVVTPGGVEGYIYRHWLLLLLLLDIVLLVLASFAAPFQHVALVLVGYTVAAALVIETVRVAVLNPSVLKRLGAIVLGLGTLGAAAYYYTRWAMRPARPAGRPIRTWSERLGDVLLQDQYELRLVFALALLVFAGILWNELKIRTNAGQSTALRAGGRLAVNMLFTLVPACTFFFATFAYGTFFEQWDSRFSIPVLVGSSISIGVVTVALIFDASWMRYRRWKQDRQRADYFARLRGEAVKTYQTLGSRMSGRRR